MTRPDAPTDSRDGTSARASAWRVLHGECSVAMGRLERVEEACRQLATPDAGPLSDEDEEGIKALLPAIQRRSGAVIEAAAQLVARLAIRSREPAGCFAALLSASNARVAAIALERLADAPAGVIAGALDAVGRAFASHEAWAADPAIMAALRKVLDAAGGPGEAFVKPPSDAVQRLAARLLDAEHAVASPEQARALLGEKTYEALAEFLAWSRATHTDLLDILGPQKDATVLAGSIQAAVQVAGAGLIRELIGRLGWKKLNAGLHIEPLVGLSLGGSFPLLLRPAEAELFRDFASARQTFSRLLIIAHGSQACRDGGATSADAIERFRAYNLLHAELLGIVTDVAPLTRTRLRRLLDVLDRVVGDFTQLFGAHFADAAILPEIFGQMRAQAEAALRAQSGELVTDGELTRLALMFEDPTSLTDVRTLHGLKRFLHQQGLRLAFRLFESGKATNRTVDILVAEGGRIVAHVPAISYLEFEPDAGEPRAIAELPPPVALVAEAFGRQLVHGRPDVPRLDVFCYGVEVHYYLRFRNHPAFVRIDYSPPAAGGMIDLEYYGVSRYEVAEHPAPDLPMMQAAVAAADYHVEVRDTRIHARYDKERTPNLEDILDRAAALFAIAPGMMELDWIVGGLAIPQTARQELIAHWADFFARWRILPTWSWLTPDGQALQLEGPSDPATGRPTRWTGQGPYRDRYVHAPPPNLLEHLRRKLAESGFSDVDLPESDAGAIFGQVAFERVVLAPLRDKLAAGEAEVRDGVLRAVQGRTERTHEAVLLARILQGDERLLARGAHVAEIVASLDRSLRFRTTGTINGYKVQRGRVPLMAGAIELFVLRDGAGIPRLAAFVYRLEPTPDGAGNLAAVLEHLTDAARLAARLRRANYLVLAGQPPQLDETLRTASLRQLLRHPNPLPPRRSRCEERIVAGTPAAPGRAVGPARLADEHSNPADYRDGVLIAPSIRPEDNNLLARAAAVVSTGGGALSHAALLAVQFGKPCLLVEGRWGRDEHGRSVLNFQTLVYREITKTIDGLDVTLRCDLQYRDDVLRDGDVVVVDAEAGRLQVLGSDAEALTLHEALSQLHRDETPAPYGADDVTQLAHRGRRLHNRHQLERHFARLRSPVLARHAVCELLWNTKGVEAGAFRASRQSLVQQLLKNPHVCDAAREALAELAGRLEQRCMRLRQEALRLLPAATTAYEVLALRRLVAQATAALAVVVPALEAGGLPAPRAGDEDRERVEVAVTSRLRHLRLQLRRQLFEKPLDRTNAALLPHRIREWERLENLLGRPSRQPHALTALREHLRSEAAQRRAAASGRYVRRACDGGSELHDIIGWKAANLAEVERLGAGARVPAWFVVTDAAFRATLAQEFVAHGAASFATLREAILATLGNPALTDEQKAAHIAALWDQADLPPALRHEVVQAYAAIAADAGEDEPFVAVRSSAREEDAEVAARAGEFETFLFVRGLDNVLAHLKKAWGSLWTARAIHNRRVLGGEADFAGGGVLVQRMVEARVAGVVQTVNLAEGRLREVIINAGLGLGAGIVSGVAAADQIIVDKHSPAEALQFRYVTADKRTQVIFNKRAGGGVQTAETLYHQRLRPALEYIELREIVTTALRLEEAYGYPLDIEFALDANALYVLQARPVADFAVVMRSVEQHPIAFAEQDKRAKE